MIFVTVGGHPYDALIEEVDRLVERGEINEEVIAQIADGRYKPGKINSFDFKYPLIPYYRMADIVIATEGGGTTFEVLRQGKKLITVIGPLTIENPDIVKYFSEKGYCIWCKELDNLLECINEVKRRKFRNYVSPPCRIHEEINNFLNTIDF